MQLGVTFFDGFEVEVTDPASDYVAVLKEVFDFDMLKDFVARPDFKMVRQGSRCGGRGVGTGTCEGIWVGVRHEGARPLGGIGWERIGKGLNSIAVLKGFVPKSSCACTYSKRLCSLQSLLAKSQARL
eukprot:92382-Chlamydomonas_euryale.AAC.1